MPKTTVNYKQLCFKIFSSTLQAYNLLHKWFSRRNRYDLWLWWHYGDDSQ